MSEDYNDIVNLDTDPGSATSQLKLRRRLGKVAEKLKTGQSSPHITVRNFLAWIDAERRGSWIVKDIRDELAGAGLVTSPDFEGIFIDAKITFRLKDINQDDKNEIIEELVANQAIDPILSTITDVTEQLITPVFSSTKFGGKYPSSNIGKMAEANCFPPTIPPDGKLHNAFSIMMVSNVSYLPVMATKNRRDVKGVLCLRSIGLHLGLTGGGIDTDRNVSDFMEPRHEVRSDSSIFDAVPLIQKFGYVLVRDVANNEISGIVTARDMCGAFLSTSEPFMLLGVIENSIRGLISSRFSLEDLQCVRDPADEKRIINGVDDLTFGEYLRLLQSRSRWEKFCRLLNREVFCMELDRVRLIRNEVMHFNTDKFPPEQLLALRIFSDTLSRIEKIGA